MFAPLRRQLRADREEAPWDRQPGLYVERFIKHLNANFDRGKDGAVAVGSAASTVAGAPGVVAALLKGVMAVLPLAAAHKLYLKWWRPELYLLVSLANEARHLMELDGEIRRIWGHDFSIAQDHDLDRFAALHARPFLTTPSIG